MQQMQQERSCKGCSLKDDAAGLFKGCSLEALQDKKMKMMKQMKMQMMMQQDSSRGADLSALKPESRVQALEALKAGCRGAGCSLEWVQIFQPESPCTYIHIYTL